MTFSLW